MTMLFVALLAKAEQRWAALAAVCVAIPASGHLLHLRTHAKTLNRRLEDFAPAADA